MIVKDFPSVKDFHRMSGKSFVIIGRAAGTAGHSRQTGHPPGKLGVIDWA
jgi:hypothetical protein